MSWSSDTQTAEVLKQQIFLANTDNSHISLELTFDLWTSESQSFKK